MNPDEQLKSEYEQMGVELPKEATPETPEALKPETDPAPAPTETPTEPKDGDTPTGDTPPEPNPEPRKRSIYHELKDTRKEVKTERELREQAERERDELKAKLAAVSTATTPQEHRQATDELEAYAQEIGADPNALRKMREVFLKGIEVPKVDTSALEEFKAWKEQNSKAIEQQQFEQEFEQVRSQFANASPDELSLIKQKLDELAHTPEFHDKELDYVIYKNKSVFDSLVSPKKRGIESKGRVDATAPTFTFDPNADITKMSATELEAWEKQYKALTEKSDLAIDAEGRKVFI